METFVWDAQFCVITSKSIKLLINALRCKGMLTITSSKGDSLKEYCTTL